MGGYYLNFALGHLHDRTGTYASGFFAFASIAAVALVALRAVAPGWTRAWLGEGGVAREAAHRAGAVGLVAFSPRRHGGHGERHTEKGSSTSEQPGLSPCTPPCSPCLRGERTHPPGVLPNEERTARSEVTT
jgi:hypothetical protein